MIGLFAAAIIGVFAGNLSYDLYKEYKYKEVIVEQSRQLSEKRLEEARFKKAKDCIFIKKHLPELYEENCSRR